MERYNPAKIQERWQRKWQTAKTFEPNLRKADKPFYNLMMFPYPSGEGLHVGHVYTFGGADTFGHYKKMKGYDVFEPMGFDSFGIHSENFAIKQKKHPKDLIKETTRYFKEEQLQKLGTLFDWSKSVTTSDPAYYRWTQWVFIQLFKAGLAERKKATAAWCPSCKTVLADEQVISGKCERCNTEIVQKELEQWFLKITEYAERLLKNLEWIDWSETTKTMQRNWIGRSEGVEIEFRLRNIPGQEDDKHSVKVYTTRPDTLFGATFLVVSPETVKRWFDIGFQASKQVQDYVQKSLNKTEVSRLEEGKDKTGVDTLFKAVHPITGELIPVWVADYVLGSYGTGAIMAVPAHDQRDYEFAKKFNLKILTVISGGDIKKEAWVGQGKLINSGEFSGQTSEEAKKNITKYLEEHKKGSEKINYHLRDWLVSRQRYWGPPIPVIYCEDCARKGKSWFTTKEAEVRIENSYLRIKNAEIMKGWYPVPEEDLPVKLPELEDYQPKGTGISPLATLPEFVNVVCPGCGSRAKRETDVSDTFLDSAWYFLRYPSVGEKNSIWKVAGKEIELPWNNELTKKWLPVDMYIGGNEHAVLHLMYARFITMVFKDLGLIDFEEPFKKFRANALIIYQGAKMSKSRGNVVNPNEYIRAYGSDALRMYLLFIGPFEQGGEFNDRAISGVYRFLNRVWTLTNSLNGKFAKERSEFLAAKIDKLAERVEKDIVNLKFNTAIAALMEFLNELYKKKEMISQEILKKYLKILAPFAPFTSEELWSIIGQEGSIHNQKWPERLTTVKDENSFELVVQVNGRYRDKIVVERRITKDAALRLALDRQKIKDYTSDKEVKQVIWVEGRLLNLVTD